LNNSLQPEQVRSTAQRDAETKAEIKAGAQAIEDKTARLKSLRLAREAEGARTEQKPPTTKRNKR